MKIFLVFLLLGLGYLLWSLFPVVTDMRDCYITNRQDFDEIAIQTRTKGWNERSICESKYDTLNRLNLCLDNAFTSQTSFTQQYFRDILIKIRKTTQPFEPEISLQQDLFNSECGQYEDLYIDKDQ